MRVIGFYCFLNTLLQSNLSRGNSSLENILNLEEFLAVIARIDIFCLCEIEKCFSSRAQRANCTKKLRAIFAKFSPKRKTLKKIHYFIQSCTLLQYLPPPPPTTFPLSTASWSLRRSLYYIHNICIPSPRNPPLLASY